MKVWFEDSVPQDLLDGMVETNGAYSMDKQRIAIEEVYGKLVSNRRNEFVAMIAPKETNAEIKA